MNKFPFAELLIKVTGFGIQIKGSVLPIEASIVERLNLKAARLQFVLIALGDQTPGVVVKPLLLAPQEPQTAWKIVPSLEKREVPPST